MIRSNRRKFVTHTAASVAGLLLGNSLMEFASKESALIRKPDEGSNEIPKDR